MTTPDDQIRGPSRDVADVTNVARQRKTDEKTNRRERKRRRKKKPGDQIASGDAQHDIGADGDESTDHSVDYLA